MNRISPIALILIVATAVPCSSQKARSTTPVTGPSVEFFERSVRPVLATKCLSCHTGQSAQSGLRLDTRGSMLKGGKRGAAILPGKASASLILEAVRGGGPHVPQMPPGSKLTDKEIAAIEEWIANGAEWSELTVGLKHRTHWAFVQLPGRVVPPPHKPEVSDIDAFLNRGSAARSFTVAPASDRRTLLRRAAMDLTGLPPDLKEIARFTADTKPDAFARAIDSLMARPQYGEQYGRHWLDVVRYADTAGENTDHPLPHAWRYRNWVINSFNTNLPFDAFVREQVAGDVLAEKVKTNLAAYSEKVTATGYLAIARRFGHDIDQDIHLTYEDTIDTLGKSILGLSLGCARCHDHKFDPISARDYYALYGIFSSTTLSFPGCEPRQQPHDLIPLVPAGMEDAASKARAEKINKIDAELPRARALVIDARQRINAVFAASKTSCGSGEIPDGGESRFTSTPQLLSVQKGDVVEFLVSPLKSHGADSTLLRLNISLPGTRARWSTDSLLDALLDANPNAAGGTSPCWYFLDAKDGGADLLTEKVTSFNGRDTLHAWRNGETPSVFVNSSTTPETVWTTLPARSFFVHPGEHGPVAIAWVSPVDGNVSVDGFIKDVHPGGQDGVGWELRLLRGAAGPLANISAASHRLAALNETRLALEKDAAPPVAYGAREGKAADVPIQKRGEPSDPGELAPRGFPAVLGGTTIRNKASSGRLELANWLTSPNNPLTARVIVNRLWQWHFGTGLVKTPNDFGTRGAMPENQPLLDYLAVELIKSGWNIKAMNRRIMLSQAYQRSSSGAVEVRINDSKHKRSEKVSNSGRFQARRLTAEELRDALLLASGQLDLSPGAAHPFPPENTWSFSQHQPFAAEYPTTKRSVYLMQKRNRRMRFFSLFDGSDPNASTPVRDLTTVPTQALFFMNDPFVFECASRSAVISMKVSQKPADQIRNSYKRLLQREPTEIEIKDALEFLSNYKAKFGTLQERRAAAFTAFTRMLMASNEFITID